MNVIITSGNTKYFPQLKMFVESLRSKGAFKGKLLICDNQIGGNWNTPTTYKEESTFTEDELIYFKKYDVEVYVFHELLLKNDISRKQVESIKGYTTRYPYKFLYCAMISKEFLHSGNSKIAYFDSDILFQSSVDSIFESINERKLYIAHENSKLGDSNYLQKWLEISNLEFGTDNKLFHKKILNENNYCSGFFAAFTDTFNSFNVLCLLTASNKFTEFFSDQPMVNIMIHFFNYPYKNIGQEKVLHLSKSLEKELEVNQNGIFLGDSVPIAVHFNGGNIDMMKELYNNTLGKEDLEKIRKSHLKEKSLLGRLKKNLRWIKQKFQ